MLCMYEFKIRRTFICSIILLGCCIILYPVPGLQAQVRSSANYDVEREVVAAGGSEAASATYANTGTFGQPGPVDLAGSANYNNQNGFWHTFLLTPAIPALSAAGIIILTGIIGLMIQKRKHLTKKEVQI